MRGDGLLRVVIAGEDEVHGALGRALVDGCVRWLADDHQADWIEPELVRRWAMEEVGGGRYFDTHPQVPWPEGGRRPQIHGHLRGQTLEPGARKLREIFLWFLHLPQPPDLLVILVDTDGDLERTRGARQVLEFSASDEAAPRLVIGLPHPEGEAWLLAAPLSPAEAARVEVARRVLGFDPCKHPERLTSSPPHAPRDAKRVLRFVRLEDGDELAEGRPPSRPPRPDEADALAASLALNLPRCAAYAGCQLSPMVQELRRALASLLQERLPPV